MYMGHPLVESFCAFQRRDNLSHEALVFNLKSFLHKILPIFGLFAFFSTILPRWRQDYQRRKLRRNWSRGSYLDSNERCQQQLQTNPGKLDLHKMCQQQHSCCYAMRDTMGSHFFLQVTLLFFYELDFTRNSREIN